MTDGDGWIPHLGAVYCDSNVENISNCCQNQHCSPLFCLWGQHTGKYWTMPRFSSCKKCFFIIEIENSENSDAFFCLLIFLFQSGETRFQTWKKRISTEIAVSLSLSFFQLICVEFHAICNDERESYRFGTVAHLMSRLSVRHFHLQLVSSGSKSIIRSFQKLPKIAEV